MDRRFCDTVKDTISPRRTSSNPKRSASRAPSVASPFPQNRAASRQPISTHGVKLLVKRGTASPMKPASSPVSINSAAHNPKPRFLK